MKFRINYLSILSILLLISSCNRLITIQAEKSRYTIIKEAQGDINLDGIRDWLVMVPQSKGERATIMILLADDQARLSQTLVNEYLTDAFLDQYNELPELAIQDGRVLLSYYGGMCHRESRTLSFKYNKALKGLYFDTLQLSSHNVCNDSPPTEATTTSATLQAISFEKFVDDEY